MELKKTLNCIALKVKNFNLFGKIKELFLSLKKNKYISFIFFLYVVSFIMFSITLFNNNFTIPLSGDFTLQEIPFYFNGYDDWWHYFKTGEFVMWDDSAMLGVNNIAANSFYYLLNPFFLVLLIVPRSIMPQAQAFMMITKMVLAGLTMKLLLQKFKVKEETTWLIATAYAFCGWNLYYLWFNHFLEVAVLMPLFILGLENIIKDQKPMLLIITIFLTGITNYFFLISFCFCGVLYAAVRYFQNLKDYNLIMKERKEQNIKSFMDIRLEVFVQGVFAFVVGLLLCAFVLMPCFSVALTNSRVTNQTYLTSLIDSFKLLLNNENDLSFSDNLKSFFDLLFTWSSDLKWIYTPEKNTLFPLIAFFTPNVSCFDSAVFNHSGYDNAYASTFIYTPLMLMMIPSFIQSLKRRSVSTIIGFFGVILLMFTPFAYYCFSGFTENAYARWYIFITVISLIFIAVQYDKRDEMSVWYLDLSFGIVIFIYGYLIYQSEALMNQPNVEKMDQRGLYMYGEIIYIVFMYIYMRKHFKKVEFTYNLRYFIALEAVVMCNITLFCQGTSTYSKLYQGQDNIQHEMKITSDLNEIDDSYFRLFSTTADRNGNNLAMMYGTGGLGTFHSIYNYELEDFLDWSQIQYGGRTGWSMGVHEKRIYLDEFLGVKYYLVKKGDTNIPFGFHEYLTSDSHVLYRNDNFIELGYAFDDIIMTQSYEDYFFNEEVKNNKGALTYSHKIENGVKYSNLSSDKYETLVNENAYLNGAILYENDIKELFGENYLSNDNFNFITSSNSLKQNIYKANIKNQDIHVMFADWDHQNNKFLKYIDAGIFGAQFKRPADKTNPEKTITNYYGLNWSSYLDIDTSKYSIGSECDSRGKCFITVHAKMGENLDITLYGGEGENEYVITSDRHMTHYFGTGGDVKYQRGFYVNEKVNRIEVKVYDTLTLSERLYFPYITYQYEDNYNEDISKLKESPLENISHTANTFSFDTSFNKDKMVVLQIPYDTGWSLQKTDTNNNQEEVKIYKGQGGFISFYGESGDLHYFLKYETPLLKEGIYLLAVGSFLVGAYYLAYTRFYLNKKRYQRMFNLS